MSKTTLNIWLDLLSFLVMLGLATTGGIIHYVLLPGTGYSHMLFGLFSAQGKTRSLQQRKPFADGLQVAS